jgi:hypothetical protein
MSLIEGGFQYVTTIEGIQLFKKRKEHPPFFVQHQQQMKKAFNNLIKQIS